VLWDGLVLLIIGTKGSSGFLSFTMLAGNQQDQHEVFGLQKISPTQKFMVCQKKGNLSYISDDFMGRLIIR